MVLNWFVESEEVFMLQMVSPLILKLSLFLVTAVATHLVMSFGQTFLHYKVAQYCPVNLRGLGQKANSGGAFRVT